MTQKNAVTQVIEQNPANADISAIMANIEKAKDTEVFFDGINQAVSVITKNIADALGLSRGMFFKLARLAMVRAIEQSNITICTRFTDAFLGKNANPQTKCLFGTYATRVSAFYRAMVFAKEQDGKPSKVRVVSKTHLNELIRDFSVRNLDNAKEWQFDNGAKALACKTIVDSMENPQAINSALTGVMKLVRSLIDKDAKRKDISDEDLTRLDSIRAALAWIEKAREADAQLTIAK